MDVSNNDDLGKLWVTNNNITSIEDVTGRLETLIEGDNFLFFPQNG